MRAGKIAVVGKANAGKSTLINVLVGEKVSIVSPRPQTTRDEILGVVTTGEYQLVFVDTPGLYRSRNRLTDMMMRTTETAARDVDLILFVHDGHAGLSEGDLEMMKKYCCAGTPALIAYTKTDIMPKDRIPGDVKRIVEAGIECDVYPISARRGTNMAAFREALIARMPEGDPLFEEDIVSDKSERFMVGEIMREKILLKFSEEVPHGVAVVINEFSLRDDGVYEISLDVVCEKPSHKAMLIGKGGRAIKEVSTRAREEMEKFLGRKVYLTTYVKVKEDWRNDPSKLREFGYGPK